MPRIGFLLDLRKESAGFELKYLQNRRSRTNSQFQQRAIGPARGSAAGIPRPSFRSRAWAKVTNVPRALTAAITVRMIRSLLKNPGDAFEPTHTIHYAGDILVVMAVPDDSDSGTVALFTEEEWL